MIAGAGVTTGRSKPSTLPTSTCNVTQPTRLKSLRTLSRKHIRLPAATPQKLLQQQYCQKFGAVTRRQSHSTLRGPASCASTAFQRPNIEDQCQVCSNTTQVPCKACKGAGRLTSSGYHKRNHVNANKVVGTILAVSLSVALHAFPCSVCCSQCCCIDACSKVLQIGT